MRTAGLVYLDNAATGFPKPRAVTAAADRCLKEYCGNAGRSSHRLALRAAEKIYECREQAAALFGLEAPENVIFTMNTTYALNMLIKGLLHEGDHVLISDMEHNSVLRPLHRLATEGKIEYDIFPTESLWRTPSDDALSLEIESRLRPNTRLLLCTHASNICSLMLPLREIGALCKKHGIFFAVDAAQSAGHTDIDMKALGIDALCAPAHKGLCGIQGVGLLVLSEQRSLGTLVEGGNGMYSLEAYMPSELPERLEAGTLPTPAVAGLCEGIRYVRTMTTEKIGARECLLYRDLRERLEDLKQIHIYLPEKEGAILLFSVEGKSSEAVAGYLADQGICVRGGYHCTALGHKTLGTPADGAVRVSFGHGNTKADLDALWRELRKL